MNEQKVGSYNPLRHKHGALWDTWKWRIPNRFLPEQKTKKSFVLRYLRPVPKVLTMYLTVQRVRGLRNYSFLKTLNARMMLLTKVSSFADFLNNFLRDRLLLTLKCTYMYD